MLKPHKLSSDQLNGLIEEYENMATDLKLIFESSYDVLFVSDGSGVTLRVSSACKQLWGKEAKELIGKSTSDLETEGIIKPSITKMVLEKKQKITAIQKTCTGRTLLVVGTPVIDKEGKVSRVVNASRDITEISQLQKEIAEMREMTDQYKQELQNLKLKQKSAQSKLIYRSKIMENIVDQIKNIARYNSTVFVNGESGVGKEIIASLLHEFSPRSDKPFIKVNCSAIPESLFESELFGYEKGTFTGGNKDGKQGLFQAANQGTIFLDEVTEMPIQSQVKLLRVLQEGEIRRIGSIQSTPINIRIVAATNKNMIELIKQGEFREDLFYRLNVIPLKIPPLRDRKEDIVPLVHFFTKQFNEQYGTNKKVDPDIINQLLQLEWKGNVRELQNFMEHLLITTDGNLIETDNLKGLLNYYSGESQTVSASTDDLNLKQALMTVERQILEKATKRYKTTVEIAKALNISQSAVSKKLKKHGISLKN